MKKRNCTKDPIVESDDERNFADNDDDEWTEDRNNLNADTNSADLNQNVQISNKKSNISAEDDNFETIGLSSTEYDPKHNLRINTKSKRSNHPIWNVFGILQNKHDGKTVAKAKDRIFCRKCFEQEESKLKRYVH